MTATGIEVAIMRALPVFPPIILATAFLSACAVPPPSGPRVAVMPGPNKTFEQFQSDDAGCRQYALQQTGYASPAQAQQNETAQGAAVGTVLGAAAGAAIGAASGNPAAGAAIGAGSGLLLGTAVGASNGNASAYEIQRGYDIAYQQCMVAHGNSLPPPPTVITTPPPVVYTYPAPPPVYYYGPPAVYYGWYGGGGPHHYWH